MAMVPDHGVGDKTSGEQQPVTALEARLDGLEMRVDNLVKVVGEMIRNKQINDAISSINRMEGRL